MNFDTIPIWAIFLATAGVVAVADVLARHAPGGPDAGNELPDQPAVL